MSRKHTSATPANTPRGRSAFTRRQRRSVPWPIRRVDAHIRQYLERMRFWAKSRAMQGITAHEP